MVELQRFYFTFGVGYDLADAYVVVDASDEAVARRVFLQAREAAGIENPRKGWSSVYDEVQWQRVVAKYGPFREVPVTTPAHGSD